MSKWGSMCIMYVFMTSGLEPRCVSLTSRYYYYEKGVYISAMYTMTTEPDFNREVDKDEDVRLIVAALPSCEILTYPR